MEQPNASLYASLFQVENFTSLHGLQRTWFHQKETIGIVKPGLHTPITSVLLGIFFSAVIAYCTYQLCLHPLAKVPGPKSWALSNFPWVYSLLRGKQHLDLHEIHAKFGQIVRIGPNAVSFADVRAWEDIYDRRPHHTYPRKDYAFYTAPLGKPQNIVTARDMRSHARMRTILSRSFGEAQVAAQAPLIEKHVDNLVSKLHSAVKDEMATSESAAAKGALINTTLWINLCTVDVIGELLFGQSFQCLDSGELGEWASNLFSYFVGMIFGAMADYFPPIKPVVSLMASQQYIRQQQELHTRYVHDKTTHRLGMNTTRKDVVYHLMDGNADFSKISREEIESNLALLVIAGSETSGTVLYGILHHLAANPRIFAKLSRILRHRFEGPDQIKANTLADIPYLDAVIHEAFRLCHPIPGGLPRISPTGGDMFAGVWIPEGTRISANTFSITRSRHYWHEPDTYVPERWLSGSERPQEYANDNLAASRPFSTGPTNCIGRFLSMAEIRMILAKLVWLFDVSEDLSEGGKRFKWEDQPTLYLVRKRPLWIRLRPREDIDTAKFEIWKTATSL